MLKVENNIFFQLAGASKKRALQAAKIVAMQGDRRYIAELPDEWPSLEQGKDLFIFFETNQKFMRQSARIGSVIKAESGILVEFETMGDPFPAENREVRRFSSVGVDLKSTFGREEDCEVVDVSPTGFAVYSSRKHEIGSRVDVTLTFEEKVFNGMVSVISVIERGRKYRYGVHCIDDPKSGRDLKKGLGQISMAIQRRQLARLSRLE
jgi:PilZ domain